MVGWFVNWIRWGIVNVRNDLKRASQMSIFQDIWCSINFEAFYYLLYYLIGEEEKLVNVSFLIKIWNWTTKGVFLDPQSHSPMGRINTTYEIDVRKKRPRYCRSERNSFGWWGWNGRDIHILWEEEGIGSPEAIPSTQRGTEMNAKVRSRPTKFHALFNPITIHDT